MRAIRSSLAFSLLLACQGPALAHPAERPGALRNGRLPATARPLAYAVELRPQIGGGTFTGSESVELSVLMPTDTLVLHANELTASDAWLDGRLPARILPDRASQTLALRFDRLIAPGRHRLRLRFAGKINTLSRGLYAIKYRDGGKPRVMLTTELEPVDARRIFPLWDEPAYRARFALTVDAPPGLTAVSNMPERRRTPLPGGWTRLAFGETPPMPSYLLALTVGELEWISRRVGRTEVRVVTTRGKALRGRYALDVAARLMPWYTAYFGAPYSLPRLDLVARPGGWDGAMENWGSIIFHEGRLLVEPGRHSRLEQQGAFALIAHELAHQWFGNLVTMAWWDDLWLNEGFASWMEQRATAAFHPEWEPWAIASASKSDAMQRDARLSTHPIRQPIHDPTDAESAFDAITYQKGEAFIRMLEVYLGQERFRAGIRRYMRRHAFGNTRTVDLWRALAEASGQPVERVARPWTERPGFPVLRVERGPGDALSLSQARFMADGPPVPAAPWPIPLRYGDRALLMETSRLVVPRGPAKLNPGDGGFYRVHYDEVLWARLRAMFPRLSAADQYNVLDDAWALAAAGSVPFAAFAEMLDAIDRHAAPAVWQRVLASLRRIDGVLQGRPEQRAFHGGVRRLLAGPAADLGWRAAPADSASRRTLRGELLAMFGHCGDEATLTEARRRFASGPAAFDPDMRWDMLLVVGRFATPAEFERLTGLARASERLEDKQMYLDALARTLDPAQARRVLALALDPELDETLSTWILQRVAWNHPDLARDFMRANTQRLLAGRPPGDAARVLAVAYDGFADRSAADELLAFGKRVVPAAGWKKLAEAAEQIRLRARLRERALPAFERWATASRVPERRSGTGID